MKEIGLYSLNDVGDCVLGAGFTWALFHISRYSQLDIIQFNMLCTGIHVSSQPDFDSQV